MTLLSGIVVFIHLGWGLIQNSVLKPKFQVEEVHDWLSSSAIYPPLELPLQPPINQNGQCRGGAQSLILLGLFIQVIGICFSGLI